MWHRRGLVMELCVQAKAAFLLYRKELRAEEFHCLTVQTRLLGELLVMTTVVQG